VTQSREPGTRTSPEPSQATDGPAPPWPRLLGASTERAAVPAGTRRPLLIGAGAVGLAVLGLLAAHWQPVLIGWLGKRPEHTLRFEEIQIEPTPPAYIRSGAAGLLARVRQAAGFPEAMSALSLGPGEVRRAFALGSPWVEAVEAVELAGHPNRLTVRLRYREPVAWIGPPEGPTFLDGNGVVLPGDDLDLAQAGPLARIEGRSWPAAPRAGVALDPSDTASGRVLRSAVRLAGFTRQMAASERHLEGRITAIDVRHGPRWLYCRTAAGLWVLWGASPEDEAPGQPTATRKWRWLQEWLARRADVTARRSDSYLAFGPTGPELRPRLPSREDP
jgi:hypothetical protein